MLIAAHNLVGHIVHTYRQILLLFSRNAAYYRSYLIKQAGQIHVGDIEYQPAAFYYAYIENIAYKAEKLISRCDNLIDIFLCRLRISFFICGKGGKTDYCAERSAYIVRNA